MNEVQSRLEAVQNRIEAAAKRAGRDVKEIKLLAVSKGHSLNKIKAVRKEGIYSFGENRVQELMGKCDQLNTNIEWHMIGHLQRNKVKYLLRRPSCILIHSVDSLRLAKEINKRARQEDRVIDILIQINTAKDDNKFGISSEQTIGFVEKVAELKHLQIKGLMTIAPYCDDQEVVRPYFRKLKSLAKDITEKDISGVIMEELSMGMTNDLEVAIEEGATILRVGSGVFGEREYN